MFNLKVFTYQSQNIDLKLMAIILKHKKTLEIQRQTGNLSKQVQTASIQYKKLDKNYVQIHIRQKRRQIQYITH